MHNNHRLNNSLLKTFVYSDVFDSPLTIQSIHTYLYKYKIDQESLSEYILNCPFVTKIGKYYVLASREKIVAQQRLKERETKKKMKIARHVARILAIIPSIQLIGVSGSVAAKNATRNADIDFFIITSKNSLWVTRFLVTGILIFMNKKRKPQVFFSPDSICTNMWMSDDALTLPKKSLFHGREVVQLKVLVNRNNTMQKFVDANAWVRHYFPNFIPVQRNYHQKSQKWINALYAHIDSLLFTLQQWYMREKQTSEDVSKQYAAFHPRDISETVLDIYRLRLTLYKRLLKHGLTYHKKDTYLSGYQETGLY